MNKSYWMDAAYRDNEIFNQMAGNDVKLTLNDLLAQEKLIAEEATELKDALDDNDPVGVLDAVVDLYVVLDGMTSKLEALGFDVSTALKQTIENNMSKFPMSDTIVKQTIDKFDSQGIRTTAELHPVFNRWAIKDQNGKIRKPIDFVSNDLSNCLPEGFTKFD